MTVRDELAALIEPVLDSCDAQSPHAIADAILSAGWRPLLKQHPPHDIDVERAPYCTVCGRDVQWNDNTEQWEH